MFRSSKIIRGYNTEFLKLSHRSAALDSLMQVSDSALAYAIDYRRSAGRASIVMGVASLTSFVLPLVVDFGDSRNAAIKWSSYGVTTVLWLHGSAVQRRANRSLSRAIWHYNLAVAEDTVRACAAASAPADPS